MNALKIFMVPASKKSWIYKPFLLNGWPTRVILIYGDSANLMKLNHFTREKILKFHPLTNRIVMSQKHPFSENPGESIKFDSGGMRWSRGSLFLKNHSFIDYIVVLGVGAHTLTSSWLIFYNKLTGSYSI